MEGFLEIASMDGSRNSSLTEIRSSSLNPSFQCSSSHKFLPHCRQFWKAGDYSAGDATQPSSKTYQNRMRVHPKFLHSNATSHKWAFGAIAELFDNAVDEACNGATSVIIDKIANFGDSHALLIQDDGGGMDPESIRHCMSFGFSNKQSNSSIGQYGNGFKTSTMRLGADVIVFSRGLKERSLTQSVGILSYTFLRQTGCDDVLVPMVDYNFNFLTGGFVRMIRHSEKHFRENLSALLRWSPFSKEEELLNQFNHIKGCGTRIIVFNLWLNDNGDPELDFDTNEKDIIISGTHKVMHNSRFAKDLNEEHIGNRFHYSLRAYASILYLRLPENFKIFLRGHLVDPVYIAEDLLYKQCIKYKPQVASTVEIFLYLEDAIKARRRVTDNLAMKSKLRALFSVIMSMPASNEPIPRGVSGLATFSAAYPQKSVAMLRCLKYEEIGTVIGFLNGAPHLDIHGFNIYHRYRLIMPFWRLVDKCRGVVGVLQVDCLKPTHDKQDFEKSDIFLKLEMRLKCMALEYWKYHCHLVGYTPFKVASSKELPAGYRLYNQETFESVQEALPKRRKCAQDVEESDVSEPQSSFTRLKSIHANCGERSPAVLPENENYGENIYAAEALKQQSVTSGIAPARKTKPQIQIQHGRRDRNQAFITMVQRREQLTQQCMELEKSVEELTHKKQMLISELEVVLLVYDDLCAELKHPGKMDRLFSFGSFVCKTKQESMVLICKYFCASALSVAHLKN